MESGGPPRRESGGRSDEPLKDRVRRLRRARGMSMDDLARATGVSRAQVSLVESGVTKWLRPETRRRYAKALGVSEEYLESGMVPDSDSNQLLTIEEWARARGELSDASIRVLRDMHDRLLELERSL